MSNPLLAQFADQPVMIAPDMLGQVKAHLAAGMAHPDFQKLMGEPMAAADDGFWPETGSWMAHYRPYSVVNGILQIPVRGIMLNEFPFATSWATGYEYIWRAFERGLADGTVRGIALMINSPGGLVSGNQTLVDKMYARRGEKPIRTIVTGGAYSAAYNIAATGEIWVCREGGVGSIGVMTTHIDWSAYNERVGLDYTFIFAGKHKVDGNPEEPLSADAKARIQSRIDELYKIFVSSVARGRDMDERDVRDTEALTFTASEATSNGLADHIGSPEDAMSAFADSLDEPSDNNGDEEMTTPVETVDKAVHEQAVADARAAGAAEGSAAERTRITAILGCENAADRPAAALAAAIDTDLSVEQANTFLGKLGKETAAAPAPTGQQQPGTFADAMQTGNPEVGASPANPDTANDDSADSVLALGAALGLQGFTKPSAK
ncbi:S49 family peptidase [Novosphingobium resinovorum]|uniref:Peptidase S49 domain-containing protein n=1 Tax=Novosphingobium resinovorum TaxID=158500 RepID=A0A1D8A377_9SPHN|nr:S49 family peptidase [Novosphingobium resinovorum]AOR76578.1 hypothetical protein BES08_07310 [Novosphingobium resinovorum]